MTVQVSDRLSQLYVGNGINTRFDFTFRAFEQEDETGIGVRVKVGNDFEFIDESEYAVTLNPDNLGGYVTFVEPPSAVTFFYIAGKTPVDQLLDITNYDNFYPDAIERALDKLTAILQEWKHLVVFETQARILADIDYDELAKQREADLKAYIDGIASAITGQPVLGLPAEFVVDGPKTQKQINSELKSLFNPMILRYTVAEIAANFTNSLNTLINEVSNTGGGTISLHDGTFNINVAVGIELKDNIELRFGKNTILKAIQTATNSYQMFRIHDRTNVKISGGRIDGNRSQQLSSTGAVYKDWKPNTAYAVGDCIALQRLGAQVTVAGTTGSTPPTIVKESNGVVKVGVNYTDGSCQYTSIQDIGEWGMGVSIRGGKDIDISDISIDNCWGDAIYVGRTDSKSYAENVSLRNIRMLNNRRQGISLVSAEKFRASSIYIANTNGTDPQSGIDLEPNLPDERLLDVVIDGLYTEGCSGHGLHVWVSPFDNLTAEENKVNVVVNNFTDVGSTRALYCSTSRKAFAKGRIEINGMRSINPKNGAIYHEACNADGVQFYLNDPYIETRDVGAKAPVRSGIAVDTNMVCGGIHIRRPRIKQLGDKYETPIIISNSNGNLKGFKNISIIDPVEIDANSSTNQGNYLLCSQNIDNFNISDSYNASRKDLNGYTYEIFHNYMQYFLSANDTAWRSITLGGIKKGRKFTVVNENLNGNGITVNFGTNITVVDWSPVGALTLISLDKRGSRIEFEAIDENVVRVLRATSDIVNNSKIMTYDYDFPDLAAGASTYVDISWSRATTVNFIDVALNVDPQGCQLRAQCLTSGTVRVRITNATNASVNLPGATLRLRIV